MNELTDAEKHVIINKGTERPFTGGSYSTRWPRALTCVDSVRRHSIGLRISSDAHCGWPSFDDELPGAVTRTLDADGRRTEITCTNCGGHLGHVFEGERLTPKNVRHCVNSVSMKFIPR